MRMLTYPVHPVGAFRVVREAPVASRSMPLPALTAAGTVTDSVVAFAVVDATSTLEHCVKCAFGKESALGYLDQLSGWHVRASPKPLPRSRRSAGREE